MRITKSSLCPLAQEIRWHFFNERKNYVFFVKFYPRLVSFNEFIFTSVIKTVVIYCTL